MQRGRGANQASVRAERPRRRGVDGEVQSRWDSVRHSRWRRCYSGMPRHAWCVSAQRRRLLTVRLWLCRVCFLCVPDMTDLGCARCSCVRRRALLPCARTHVAVSGWWRCQRCATCDPQAHRPHAWCLLHRLVAGWVHAAECIGEPCVGVGHEHRRVCTPLHAPAPASSGGGVATRWRAVCVWGCG